MSLTPGSARSVANADIGAGCCMQCVEISAKKMGKNTRFTLFLSDGDEKVDVLLASSLNALVDDNGPLTLYSILRVKRLLSVDLSNQPRALVLSEMEIVDPARDKMIGDPKAIDRAPEPKKNEASSSSSSSGFVRASRAETSFSMPKERAELGSLNVFSGTDWIVRARVTKKGPIRTWNNARGEGKLFGVDLFGADGTKMRATLFRDAVDSFYDKIFEGKTYDFSGGQVKEANPDFNRGMTTDVELNLDGGAEITEIEEEADAVPAEPYDFVAIKDLDALEDNADVDVIGVIRGVDEVDQITSRRTGKQVSKRSVHIADARAVPVEVTFWGKTAEDFSGADGDILAVRAARKSTFREATTLSVSFTSKFELNPCGIPEAEALRRAADEIASSGLPKRGGYKTLSAIDQEGLGSGESPDYFKCTARVHRIAANVTVYHSCLVEGCNARAEPMVEGGDVYYCTKGHPSNGSRRRIILRADITDDTAIVPATVFHEQALQLLRCSLDQLIEAVDAGNTDMLQVILDESIGIEFTATIRCTEKAIFGAPEKIIAISNIQ